MSSQLVSSGFTALRNSQLRSVAAAITGRSVTRCFAREADAAPLDADEASLPNFPYPPEAWEAEVAAFVTRLNVPIGNAQHYETAMTHPSVARATDVPLWQTNSRLAFLGRNLMNSYTAQHLVVNHPRLLSKSMIAALDTYSSTKYLHNKAVSIGVPRVLRWMVPHAEEAPSGLDDAPFHEPVSQREMTAYAGGFKALVGAVYLDQGDDAARAFTHHLLLSDPVEVLVKSPVERPKIALQNMLRRENKGRPVYKLLRESGRLSHAPVFVVGVYVDGEMMGEGVGSALKKAEAAAAINVLTQYYGEVGDATMPEPFSGASA